MLDVFRASELRIGKRKEGDKSIECVSLNWISLLRSLPLLQQPLHYFSKTTTF